MRGKTFAALVVVGMLAVGGQKAYVAFTNRKPLKTTCADYINSSSGAKWVELTGCSLDYDRAIQLTGQVFKTDKGVFVPVRPIRSKSPAPILLHFEKEEFV